MLGDQDDFSGREKGCNCPHLGIAHMRTGACPILNCGCGWIKDKEGVFRERGTGLTKEEARERQWRRNKSAYMRELYGKPCHYCGKEAKTVDHVVPKSRGGKNAPENVVAACYRCNNLKGDMSEEEFIEYCCHLMWQEYGEEKYGDARSVAAESQGS